MLSSGQHNNLEVAGRVTETLRTIRGSDWREPCFGYKQVTLQKRRKPSPLQIVFTNRLTRIQKRRNFTLASSFPKESFWGSWLVFRQVKIHTYICMYVRTIKRMNPFKKSPCTLRYDLYEQRPVE